jgi:NAD(P)-dependent dehydrogenase (short-subunit alcohol dehydrogenase family)
MDPLCAACRHPAVGSVLADAPKAKNAKVTLVYQHELPNVPGKRIKGVLVEYGPGGYSPGHTHAKSAFIYATVVSGVGADAVAFAGQLGEALSGLVGCHRSVVDLTADRPLEHDVLINSAGINGKPGQTTGNVDYISWAQVLDVNTMGPLRVTEALVDYIARSKRKLVVTITSGMGSLADNTWGGSIA